MIHWIIKIFHILLLVRKLIIGNLIVAMGIRNLLGRKGRSLIILCIKFHRYLPSKWHLLTHRSSVDNLFRILSILGPCLFHYFVGVSVYIPLLTPFPWMTSLFLQHSMMGLLMLILPVFIMWDSYKLMFLLNLSALQS